MSLIIILIGVTNGNALEVRITGDRLSVIAEQVPLQDILTRIAALGIRIRIDPGLNPEISASFQNRDMQKGMESILKTLSHIFIWESIQGPPGPITRLAEIQIFKPGKKDLMKPLWKRANLEIATDPGNGSQYVKHEILLRLEPGIRLSEFQKLLSRIGGTVVASHNALGLYRIRLPVDADVPTFVEQLKNQPDVADVAPNYAYPVIKPNRDTSQSFLLPSLSDFSASNLKVPVAILDTGLIVDSGLEDAVLASLDALNPDVPISDALGHGTQMAMIASGAVRPIGVKSDPLTHNPIVAIRAFDDNGFTSDYHLMQSIDFAIENGARVVSMSWGSENRSPFLEDLFDYANSKGLVTVASAGNEPTGNPVYPAAYNSVIGVGALKPDGSTWEKSNFGDFVKLYAPGFATLPVGYKAEPGTYAGTSISTAFVANVIANYLSQNPNATMEDVFKALGGK